MSPRRSARTSALLSAAVATAVVLCATPGESSHPTAPLNLLERNADGTGLADGGVTSEGPEVELTASSASATCNWGPYSLEFEVRPTAQAFTGLPTHYSVSMAKASCVQQQFPFTKISGLAASTAYHWRVREKNVNGGVSAWSTFNAGATGFTTTALPARRVVFTTPAVTLVAGTCSGATTVQQQDLGGAPVPVPVDTPVTPFQSSTVAPSTQFFSDPACMTAAAAVTMAAGQSTATFYWRSTRAGAVTLSADLAGALWGEQSQTINPGPATQLAFADTNNYAFVEGCSPARTIQLRDQYLNATPAGAGGVTVNLLSSLASTLFFTDAACTVSAGTSITVPQGSAQASFYFRDDRAGPRTLTARVTGLTDGLQTAYTYGNIRVISLAQSVDAGQCANLTTVQAQNGSSIPYAMREPTTVYLYGSTGMSFYTDPGCDAGFSQKVLDAGESSVSFYWRSTAASPPNNPSGGSIYLYGSGSYYFGYTQTQTVKPGPPYRLGFGTVAQTVTVGTCSGATMARVLDVYGNYSPVTTALTVGLQSSSAGASFHTDSLCATAPVASVSVPAGASNVSFYWKDNTPGSPVLTLSNAAPGLLPATQTQTVRAKLAFATPAQSLVAGACSSVTTVQAQDGTSAPWNVAAATVVSLSTSSPTGPFFSDSACTVSISSVTIAAGTSSAGFYWKDTTAGGPVLSATAAALTGASQTQTIVAGPVSDLLFVTPPQVVGASLCSAAVTIRQQDVYGNPATQGTARTVSLLSTSASGTFYSAAGCPGASAITSVQIPAGLSTATYYWSDTLAGTPTHTLRSAPLLDVTQTQTVSVGAATRLAFLGSGQMVGAGQCSAPATVQSQDVAGNPSSVLSSIAVGLTSSTGSTAFYASGDCTGAPVAQVTIPAGSSSAAFSWKETRAGSLTLTAAAAAFSSGQQTQTVVPAAPDRLAFTSAEQSISASACSAAVGLAATDLYGNASAVGASTSIGLTATSPTLSFFSDATCTTAISSLTLATGASAASFWFLDASTGNTTLTASGLPSLLAASQNASIGGREQVRVRWYSAAGAPLAGENATAEIPAGATVHLRVGVRAAFTQWRLASGDVLVSGEVFANKETWTGSYLSTQAADGALEVLTEARVGNGQQRYETLGDPALAGQINHVYTFGAGLPAARPAYPLCLTARTTGEALRVGYSFTAAPGTATFPAGWQLTSTALAETCFDLKAQGYNGGPLTVYLQDALRGAGSDSVRDTFSLDQVVVKGDPPVLVALERSTSSTFTSPVQVLTGELWDDLAVANGAPVTATLTGTTDPEIYVELRPSTPINQTDLDSGQQGEWDFAVRFPSTGGTFHYRLVVTDALGTKTGTLESYPVLATAETAASALAFTTAPHSIQAGACSGDLTVEARDPAGNPRASAAARTVTLATAASGRFYAGSGCAGAPVTQLTIPAGQSQATFSWSDTVVGTPTITASSAGLTPASQVETVTAGPASQVVFVTAAQNVTVGACSALAQVEARDAYGNPAPVATSGPLTATSGTLRFYSAPTCAAGSQLTALAMTTASARAGFYFLDTAVGTATVTYAPVGLTPASQGEQFSMGVPTQLAFLTGSLTVSAGQCSGAVLPGGAVVQAQDSFGNPGNVTADLAVGLASDSPTLAFFSDVGCTVPVASRTIVAPGTTAAFYFRDTVSGPKQLTATSAGLLPANQGHTVQPGPAVALRFTTAPQTVVAGGCSGALSVRSEDAYGNVSPAAMSTLLSLSSTAGPSTAFYSDACATAASGVTLPAGASAATFHFRDTLAGTPTLTVSGLGTVAQPQTVQPGPTSALRLAGFPSPVTAGAASGFTVTAVDAFGNVAADYAGTVQFASTDGRATLPPVASFTPGTGSQSFAATLITAGSHTLSASDNGLPPRTAQQGPIQVNPAAAATLQVSGVASPTTAGAAHDLTVGAVDAFGNQATSYGGTIRLTSTDPQATLPPDSLFLPGDQGRRVFTGGVTLRTPGTHRLTATDLATSTVTGEQAGVVVLQVQGGTCAADGDCATGVCANQRCCDRACPGPCLSCALAGREGTCSALPNGTSCANTAYCDGVETCQAGACAAGAPVACVDPEQREQLACDEATRTCVGVPSAPPAIVHDASPLAAQGLAYAYNAAGRVTALGQRPMTFASCGGPPGFRVEPSTGEVSWLPAAAGTFQACVAATNARGQDSYTFTVQVDAAPAGAGPAAAFAFTPASGPAPLDVLFDGSGSSVSAAPASHLWDFGDLSVLGTGAQLAHQYLLPGSYQVQLLVRDGYGRSAVHKAPALVTDPAGAMPPTAVIGATTLSGDGSAQVIFSCDCRPGDGALAAYAWELGDQARAFTPTVTAAFPPGRHRVRLTVVDRNGLTGHDSVEVVVTRLGIQPPRCRVGLKPPAGPAPLTVEHRASYGDDEGPITSATFTFADGTTAPGAEATRTYDAPGRYPVTLRVQDEQGLPCADPVWVTVTGQNGALPPRIISLPTPVASCGVPYRYSAAGTPEAVGQGPFSWELLPAAGGALPAGMAFNPGTGEITWTPSSALVGTHRLILRVNSAAGPDQQEVAIDVQCAERPVLDAGCACGTTSGLSVALAGLVLLALRAVRLRPAPGSARSSTAGRRSSRS